MIRYAAPVDLAEEPPSVAIDGDTVTLSSDVVHYDNTGLWGAQQLSCEWPDHPSADDILSIFDVAWIEWSNQYMAQQQDDSGDGSDALLTDMYEQMLTMQEAQEATDAALCDLYEAMGGEQ